MSGTILSKAWNNSFNVHCIVLGDRYYHSPPYITDLKLRHAEVEEHIPNHTDSEQRSWDLKLGSLTPELGQSRTRPRFCSWISNANCALKAGPFMLLRHYPPPVGQTDGGRSSPGCLGDSLMQWRTHRSINWKIVILVPVAVTCWLCDTPVNHLTSRWLELTAGSTRRMRVPGLLTWGSFCEGHMKIFW